MNAHARTGRVTSVTATLLLLATVSYAGEPPPGSLKPLPKPYETIPDRTSPSVVRLGPGNTFSVGKTSPDFYLNTFAMTPDGRVLALGWESGRIELWEMQPKRPLCEFKSSVGEPLVLSFIASGGQLIVAGPGGKTAFFEIPSGKELRRWKIPRGKAKYDMQVLVMDPAGKWLAYANEDNSKVLDLTASTPTPLADLKDAGSITLSPDSTELWTVNRTVLRAFNTSTWRPTGEWTLKSPPLDTSSVVVRAGVTMDGERTVAVPSAKGLVIYRGPQVTGEFATERPSSVVEYARAGHVYVDLSSPMTFLDPAGHVRCRRTYDGRYGSAISDDGQWLALSQSSRVDLWRMEDLLRECAATP